MALRHWFILCDVGRIGRPPSWLTTAVAILDIWGHAPDVRNRDERVLGLGIDDAADTYLLACINGESGLSRYDVVDLPATLFHSIACRLSAAAPRL
jgi:hypothetical protein